MNIEKKDYLLGQAVALMTVVGRHMRVHGNALMGEQLLALAAEIKKELGME